MLALCCVAFTFTSCGDDPVSEDSPSAGTKANPYTVKDAINAVKGLTWTNNTEYETTDDVYVKGKISRIAEHGTYTESGTFSNASFYISEDGTENKEFYCYRLLYFGRKAYQTGQKDIKVGDEVVICGKLMNFKNGTPETVANQAWLYSLNGATDGGPGSEGGNTVSFDTNSSAETWEVATDATYGSGFSTTKNGLKIGYYKHTCSVGAVAPNMYHVRIYKNSVLSIASVDGKRIKKIVIGCSADAGSSSYCFDMVGLEGDSNGVADKSALTVTWVGSAKKVVLQSNKGQVRMEKLTVEFE